MLFPLPIIHTHELSSAYLLPSPLNGPLTYVRPRPNYRQSGAVRCFFLTQRRFTHTRRASPRPRNRGYQNLDLTFLLQHRTACRVPPTDCSSLSGEAVARLRHLCLHRTLALPLSRPISLNLHFRSIPAMLEPQHGGVSSKPESPSHKDLRALQIQQKYRFCGLSTQQLNSARAQYTRCLTRMPCHLLFHQRLRHIEDN